MMKRSILQLASCALLLLGGCDRETTDYPGQPGPGDPSPVGFLSLADLRIERTEALEEVDVEVIQPYSRAAEADAPAYRVELYDPTGACVGRYDAAALPAEALELPSGSYRLRVASGDLPAVGTTPVYACEQHVAVRKGETAAPGLFTCAPVTARVNVEYMASIHDQLDPGTQAVVRSAAGEYTFAANDPSPAYFAAETTLDLTLEVTGSYGGGTPLHVTRRAEAVKGGQAVRFLVGAAQYPAPTIEWVDHDIDQRYEATEALKALIRVTAPGGIRGFTVDILSEKVLTEEVLQSVSLTSHLDLVDPGQYEEALNGLNFPTGDAVVNETEVEFDISDFMGLIPLLGTGDSDFRLTVTDSEGTTVVASIKVYSTHPDDRPVGPEQGFPGGEARPMEPPHNEQTFPDGDASPFPTAK